MRDLRAVEFDVRPAIIGERVFGQDDCLGAIAVLLARMPELGGQSARLTGGFLLFINSLLKSKHRFLLRQEFLADTHTACLCANIRALSQ